MRTLPHHMRALRIHNARVRKHEKLITDATMRILSPRPLHHGIAHAVRVCALSERIAPPSMKQFLPTIRVIALSHDIGDGKFNDDTPRWHDALTQVPRQTLQWCTEISKRVSFSRELVHGRDDWFPTLGAGIAIRAIVSDADKLDSLGIAGYQRLQEYNREKLDDDICALAHGPAISQKDYNAMLHTEIWRVITVRQQMLAAYMQTQYGRDRAPELFRELVQQHHAWMRSVNMST
jgi:hypothetical protein